ncbi:MAG: HAD-IA family hydrolase [Burkholderiaceae bacterium]|nr:HAD-IA family hydrolase [Burkholderiaceae bacterium]
MNQAHFRLVVFDWDGTLIDSTGAIVQAIQASAADLALPVPSRERALHVIGLGLYDAIRLAVPGIAREQMLPYAERYRFHYLRRDLQLEPFDGVPELLGELADRGAWLAVATGKSRAGLDRALARMGWGARFLTTRCADEGAPKPDPWMLRDICDELGLAASEAVMVGDTTHDLGMARAAGSNAIAVTYGAHRRRELVSEPALALVDSVAELRAALLAGLAPAMARDDI